MKTNGSIYVAVVLAALTGYFVYQWWFNPNRMVKARLGDIAAVLSIPANEAELGRVTRLAQLRKLATPDVHVRIGKEGADLTSRDAVLAAVPANVNRSLAEWHTANGAAERAGVKIQLELIFAAVEARVQAQNVAGELPGGAGRPLMAVTPARIEDFRARREAAGDHPAPASAELVENEIDLAVRDEHGHREMREVGRDDT